MPLYDYRCRACSKVTEVRHGFREPHQAACPECGGELARVFTPAGIVFKGSGFYLTDSRKAAEKSSKPAEPASASAESTKPADGAKTSEASPAATTAAPAAATAPASSGTPSAPKPSESSAA